MSTAERHARAWETGRCYDHTAPWRCGLSGCELCEGKPSYDEWAAARDRR